MPIVFDPQQKRIVLDSTEVSATEIYSRAADWLALGDNAKYGAVFRQVGGDDLGAGLSIPAYFFLQGSWRVRPMESNHDLKVVGNLFVEGGGTPVTKTLGSFQVNVNYTVPVQAQALSTGGSGASASEIAAEVRLNLANELEKIMQVAMLHGLGATLVVSETNRTAGTISQSISTTGSTTTVTQL